jgi:NAD(P)-dependent dehydrogenase (short-subunit alcohol dehydrogenase family)
VSRLGADQHCAIQYFDNGDEQHEGAGSVDRCTEAGRPAMQDKVAVERLVRDGHAWSADSRPGCRWMADATRIASDRLQCVPSLFEEPSIRTDEIRQPGDRTEGPGWFAGSTGLVTGAAKGIGEGVARMLAELGARVVALDVDEAALEHNLRGDAYVRRPADLGSGEVSELADDLWGRDGPIDLLVNNVGIDTPHRFGELSEWDFDLVFRTNLRGPWFFTKRLVERMLAERRRGAVVFVSSLHDTFIRRWPHYSASKAAVSMLVKELAQELAPHGIRVNAVSPGVVESAHVAPPGTRDEAEEIRNLVPLGRMGVPKEVARMVAVLLSDEWAGYVTGANVRVDGGLGLHSWSLHGSCRLPSATDAGENREG